MLIYHCHPALEKVLKQNLAVSSGQFDAGHDIYMVSTFLPQHYTDPYGGIEEAVQLRVKNQHTWIVLFSFMDIEHLKPVDQFNLLSLKGAVFLRLPFQTQGLEAALATYASTLPNLSDTEWQSFIENVSVSKIKMIISSLKHGGKLDLGNKILNPMRMAALTLIDFPSQNKSIEQIIVNKIEELKKYLQQDEIRELMKWKEMSKNTFNPSLLLVQKFIYKLSILTEGGTAPLIIYQIDQIYHLLSQIKDNKY